MGVHLRHHQSQDLSIDFDARCLSCNCLERFLDSMPTVFLRLRTARLQVLTYIYHMS